MQNLHIGITGSRPLQSEEVGVLFLKGFEAMHTKVITIVVLVPLLIVGCVEPSPPSPSPSMEVRKMASPAVTQSLSGQEEISEEMPSPSPHSVLTTIPVAALMDIPESESRRESEEERYAHPATTIGYTSEAEPTATPVPTIRAVTRLGVTIIPIESFVLEAFWLSDVEFMYAEYNRLDESAQWKTYNVRTHTETTASSPRNYDESVWEQLGVPRPPYAETTGRVSPSGKYVLYEIRHGEAFSGTMETWIADVVEGRHSMLLQQDLPGLSVVRGYWFDDESKALLFLRYEGTGWWVVVDVQSGTLVYLGEMSDYEGFTSEKPFAVSPDGRLLAVEDADCRLVLVSAEDGAVTVVEKGALWYAPSWSTDGSLLYYWSHSSEGLRDDWEEIRVYDVERDQISALLDRSAAARLRLYSHDYFSVSPDEDYILFWGNRLRLVNLGR